MNLFRDLYFSDSVISQGELARQQVPLLLENIAGKGHGFDVNNTEMVCQQAIDGSRAPMRMPCVRPPFDFQWFEFLSPHVAEEIGSACVVTMTRVPPLPGEFVEFWQAHLFIKRLGAWMHCPRMTVCVLDAAGDLVSLFPALAFDGNDVARQLAKASALVDEGTPEERLQFMEAPGALQAQRAAVRSVFSLSLMNCRGAKRVERAVPPKVLKKRRAKGEPEFKTYVLDVEPTRLIREPTGRKAGESGIEMSQHFCRGHFGDYREKGLFGKHKGLFWFGPHIRGNPQVGVIDKSYSIAAPEVMS